MNNETMLLSLVKNTLDNKINYDDFSKKIYDEVYSLTYPVAKNKKTCEEATQEAIKYVYENLKKIDIDKNIYRQIATFVSTYLLKLYLEEDLIDANDIGYSYDKLKEDKELLNVTKNNVTAFRNVRDFKGCGKKFKKLAPSLMAILELFGYEMHSVKEISSITGLSEDYIRGLINEIRRHYEFEVLNTVVSVTEPVHTTIVDLDKLHEELTAENLNKIDKTYHDTQKSDKELGIDTKAVEDISELEIEEISLDSDETYVSKEELEAEALSSKILAQINIDEKKSDTENVTNESKNAKSVKIADDIEDLADDEETQDVEHKAGPLVRFFGRLFPDLSLGQARVLTYSMALIIAALVIVIAVIPVIKSNNSGEIAGDQGVVESISETESETQTTTTQTQSATTATTATTTTTTTATESSTKASQTSKSSESTSESSNSGGSTTHSDSNTGDSSGDETGTGSTDDNSSSGTDKESSDLNQEGGTDSKSSESNNESATTSGVTDSDTTNSGSTTTDSTGATNNSNQNLTDTTN